MHFSGNTDAARVGETLQPSRDVDPVAENLLALDHHVAEVDPDAKLHPALGWQTGVFSLEGGLDLDRALDRIHHAGELRQYAVPGRVYESAVVLFDEPIDYRAMCRQGADRRLFVLPHEATVAVDVGAEDGGELAFHTHLSAHHPAKY